MRSPGSGPAGALEYFMPDPADPAGPGKQMTPAFFLTGQSLQPGASDRDRRQALGTWLTARTNPWFARAFVNRLWSELMGEGFFEPVDDLGRDRDTAAPRTLDFLAGRFIACDYDVKWLFRTLMETEVYQRESRPRRNPEQPPLLANVPQPLRADVLVDVLCDALGVDLTTARAVGTRASRGPATNRRQLQSLFGYDPSAPRDGITASIPQVLLLMNSPIVNQALEAGTSQSILGLLLANTPDDRDVAVALYLRCLARRPSDDELAICLECVQGADNRTEAFEDLLWGLLNSEEFRHRN
jgi:hypothetical protein